MLKKKWKRWFLRKKIWGFPPFEMFIFQIMRISFVHCSENKVSWWVGLRRSCLGLTDLGFAGSHLLVSCRNYKTDCAYHSSIYRSLLSVCCDNHQRGAVQQCLFSFTASCLTILVTFLRIKLVLFYFFFNLLSTNLMKRLKQKCLSLSFSTF